MGKKTSEFGCLCRQYRVALKINMSQAAKKIGVNQSDITKIEQGEQSPSFDFIKKSIDVYQITDKKKQMEFFISNLNSSKNIEIPLNGFGPKRKEWLAALCILGEVGTHNPTGWKDLLEWIVVLASELQEKNPKYDEDYIESNPL